jgi:hypothetical protein
MLLVDHGKTQMPGERASLAWRLLVRCGKGIDLDSEIQRSEGSSVLVAADEQVRVESASGI